METKNLAELPLVFQVIAGAGLFFGTFMLAIGGWLWPKIKEKLPEAFKPAEAGSTDVIIRSASIADSQAISHLGGSIERMIEFLRENAEDDSHQMKRNRDVLCEIRDELVRARELAARRSGME